MAVLFQQWFSDPGVGHVLVIMRGPVCGGIARHFDYKYRIIIMLRLSFCFYT